MKFDKRLKPHLLFLCIIWYVLTSSFAYSFDVKNYCKQSKCPQGDSFVKNFPYDQYFQTVSFTDFKKLQADRLSLWRIRGDGDDFLYYLGENFIKRFPVTLEKNNLKGKIQIGEAYLNAAPTGNRNADAIYDIIGYYVLGRVAQTLEKAMQQGKFNPDTPENKQLIKQLEKSKVYVTIERSSAYKLLGALKKGNIKYVVNRGWLKIKGLSDKVEDRYQQALGDKFFDDFFIRKSLARRNNPTQQCRAKSNLKLSDFRKFYPKSGEHDLNILELKDSSKSPSKVGYCIWMNRPGVKATYLAYETAGQSVYQRFQNLAKGKRIVLATTGGFTNQYFQPEGLTIEKGNIVNAVLMPDRHGLVIVHDSGGISVINLKRAQIKLALSPTTVLTIDNPLHSLVSFSKLLEWCKKNQATLFQTQLLAFSDQLLINPQKARTQFRERRILSLSSDRGKGSVAHVLFNIVEPYNLVDAAQEIFNFLKARNKKVEAILNLDVGAYDILHVFDPKGQRIQQVHGKWRTPIQQATNLIVYTRP